MSLDRLTRSMLNAEGLAKTAVHLRRTAVWGPPRKHGDRPSLLMFGETQCQELTCRSSDFFLRFQVGMR